MTQEYDRGTAGADGDETEAIRVEIEQTRVEMGGTLDAIQDRLNPEILKDQAKDVIDDAADQAKEIITTAVREAGEQAREVVREATTQAKTAVHDATIGKAEEAVGGATRTVKGFGTTMLDTIKQNPVPAALAAIGIGWLFMKGRGDTSGAQPTTRSRSLAPEAYLYGEDYEATGTAYTQDAYTLTRRGDATGGDQGDGASQGGAGQMVGQAGEAIGNVAGQAGGAIGGAVDQARGIAGEAATQAQEAVGRMAGAVQDRTGRITSGVSDRTERMADESPLLLGGLALAAGTVVGLLMPTTEQENQLFGSARDNLLQQAKSTAKDLQPAVERATEAVQQAVQETMQEGDGSHSGSPSAGAAGRSGRPDAMQSTRPGIGATS